MNIVSKAFETGANRYQPDPNFTYGNDPAYTVDQHLLAAFVGLAALGLPLILYAGTYFGTCLYDSISHFYYARFLGGVFVAALVFIATFLIAYRGENPPENRLATFAGLCALGTALFPTEGRGCELLQFAGRPMAYFSRTQQDEFMSIAAATAEKPYFSLFSQSAELHFIFAGALFAFLAYYSFFVFTRVIPDEHCPGPKNLTDTKQTRNTIYYVTGTVIVAVIVVLFAKYAFERLTGSFIGWWNPLNLTFWLETAALWSFGIAWTVKGRFFNTYLLDRRDVLGERIRNSS